MSPLPGIRIILADDHRVVREGIRGLLEREGFSVLGEGEDGNQAVELVKARNPDIAVLDFSMPHLNGLDAAKVIARDAPRTRTILLTVHTEEHYVLSALRADVKGYVIKTQAGIDLVKAIREVHGGAVYLSPSISHIVVDAYLGKRELQPDPLTTRERQVLQLVAEGMSTKEIASALDISAKTAESHRCRIMEKLDIHETANLVRYAVRTGLIEP